MQLSQLKDQLCQQYSFRIELHAHTKPVSGCSEVLPEELVAIYREKGYDAVVVTNHFIFGQFEHAEREEFLDQYLADYEKTVAAAEDSGLRVLLGAELRFAQNCNDYLLFGVDREILATCYNYLPKGLEAFRREVSLPNSVFVQAHPFRDGMTPVDLSLLDGIETFNMHPGHNSRVGFAARCAKDNRLPIRTVGTDFHHKNQGHEGISALRTATLPNDSFELAALLRSGDYVFEIGEGSIVLP